MTEEEYQRIRANFADFIGTDFPYDIDKPEHPPMKQANARIIERPELPEK